MTRTGDTEAVTILALAGRRVDADNRRVLAEARKIAERMDDTHSIVGWFDEDEVQKLVDVLRVES